MALIASVKPDNAANKSVTWRSDNEAVATVDAEGKVTAVGVGTATITATTVDGSDLSASCAVEVVPVTVTIGGIVYEVIPTGDGEEKQVKVTDGSGAAGEVKLPSAVQIDGENYTVVEVGEGAFKDNAEITRLVIPATVGSIGDEAFAGCTKLVDVVAQDGEDVLAFGRDVFSGAPIEQLYRGRTNTGNPFAGMSTLESLTIGEKVGAISDGEFAGCGNIVTVNVYNPVPPTITDACFEQTVYDNATLTVPDGSIDDYNAAPGWRNFATTNSTSEIRVTAITIRRQEIGVMVGDAEKLIAYITPDNATNKAVAWKSDNESVATVDAEGNVKGIAVGKATITATTTDGSNRSARCVVTVTPLRKAVGDIVYEVVPGKDGEDDHVKVIGGKPDADGILEIPGEIEIEGKKYPVTEIGEGAFKNRDDIKKVIIPESVVNVGDEAFAGCPNLKEVVTEDGDKTLTFGSDVFTGCPIEIIYDGRNNSGNPFAGNDNLREVTIGEKVDALAPGEFAGCPGITDITVLNPVPPTVGSGAFDDEVYNGAVLRVPNGSVDDYKAANGWKDFFKILGVNEVEVTAISLSAISMTIEDGATSQLTVTITPDNATYKSVTWSSSDEAVARVSTSGLVTGVAAGSATIKATTSNGLTATCAVTVTAKQSGIEGVEGDSTGVRVEGNAIIAPEGSKVYDLSGREVTPSALTPGIYIVRIPGGKAVKVKV